VPDRIVITPEGETCYIEIKNNRGKLSPLQEHHIKQLRRQGARVWVAYGKDGCDDVIKEIMA
jgi:hypothetical protein